MIEMFRAYQDINYDFKIDNSKSFEEQNLMIETKAILANIFRDYWATPYQQERIIAKEHYDMEMMEKEKRERYSPDNIFKNKDLGKNEEVTEENIQNNLPIEIQKKNFFEKLISFFKKMLQR